MKRTTTRPAIESSGVPSSDLDRAIASSQAYLLALQHADGYWAGELEADASVTAGYLPLMHWLGREVSSGAQAQGAQLRPRRAERRRLLADVSRRRRRPERDGAGLLLAEAVRHVSADEELMRAPATSCSPAAAS